MNEAKIDLIDSIARQMVDARLADFRSLAETHGMSVAASVMLSMCAEIAGTALATAKEKDARIMGGIAFTLAMKKAMENNSAVFETLELIDRVKEPS